MISNNVSLNESDDEISEENTPAQPQKRRNTKCAGVGKGLRKRAWAFTLNGYKPENIITLEQRKFNYRGKRMTILRYLFQEEITKKMTKHLQGCLYFHQPVSFECVKCLMPKAHIEPAKNWHALLNYCSKNFTRNGKIYRYGCLENRVRVQETPEAEEDRWADWRARQVDLLRELLERSMRGINLDV